MCRRSEEMNREVPAGHKANEPIFKHQATFNNLQQLWLAVLQDWKQHKQN